MAQQVEYDVDEAQGPPMLATTPALRIKSNKIRMGKLQLAVRPIAFLGVSVGVVGGLFFGYMLHLTIWNSMGAFIFPVVFGATAGYGLSLIQPLPGETRRTWLILRIRHARQSIKTRNGPKTQVFLGAAPLQWTPADVEVLMFSATRVPVGTYDRWGRKIEPQGGWLPDWLLPVRKPRRGR